MLSDLFCSATMDFDLPADCDGAELIAKFDRDLVDQEYIIGLSFADGGAYSSFRLPELSWSNSLQKAFVYITELPAGGVFRSPRFKIPNGVRIMQVHCQSWKSQSTEPEQSLQGLAVEASIIGPPLTMPTSRIVIPGKKIPNGVL